MELQRFKRTAAACLWLYLLCHKLSFTIIYDIYHITLSTQILHYHNYHNNSNGWQLQSGNHTANQTTTAQKKMSKLIKKNLKKGQMGDILNLCIIYVIKGNSNIEDKHC